MNLFESINKGFESKYGDLDSKKEKKVTECDKVGVQKESCNKKVKECADTRLRGKKAINKSSKLEESSRIVKEGIDERHKKVKSHLKEYKDMGQDLSEYQKWVDYDMKRYHKISDKTMDKIKEAGLTVVKDQYGDYEVIAHEPVREAVKNKGKKTVKESLKLIMDIGDYHPWSGAVDTFDKIRDADMVDALENYLEDIYPEGLTVTELNDILWFDGDTVLRDLGLSDEEEDEDEDAEDIDESCKKSVKEGKSVDFKKFHGCKK